MGAMTFLLAWTGYWVMTYGIATVRGCNVTLVQIGWPGRYTGCHPDVGSNSTSGSTSAAFNNATDNANKVLSNPNSTAAEKQGALQKVANAGASTPITPGGIISGIFGKLHL